MKKFIYITLVLVFALASSCTKEIKIKFNHDYNRLVVEAALMQGEDHQIIRVTREASFLTKPQLILAEDLVITVSDEQNNVGTFHYIGNGYYQLDNYSFSGGVTYTLSIVDGENIIEAKSLAPSQVSIDEISFETVEEYGMEWEVIRPVFIDPVGENNYYFIKVEKRLYPPSVYTYYEYEYDDNYNLLDSVLISDTTWGYNNQINFTDNGMDGQENPHSIYISHETGDTLIIILSSIDENRYVFEQTLYDAYYNGGFGATPSNPISNFKDKALGYFSVEIRDRKVIVVP